MGKNLYAKGLRARSVGYKSAANQAFDSLFAPKFINDSFKFPSTSTANLLRAKRVIMTIEAKKSVSKISLALLIVVISLVSSQTSAHHPQSEYERELAKICRDQIDYNSGYETEHRKCFVEGSTKMPWTQAKHWCQNLPRLPHFGLPELATIDLKGGHMNHFMKNTVRRAYYYHWTGAHIPPRFVSSTKKNNNEWRWEADNSRLSQWDPVWYKGGGYPEENYPKEVCGFLTTYGLIDSDCDRKFYPLCHYKAK